MLIYLYLLDPFFFRQSLLNTLNSVRYRETNLVLCYKYKHRYDLILFNYQSHIFSDKKMFKKINIKCY